VRLRTWLLSGSVETGRVDVWGPRAVAGHMKGGPPRRSRQGARQCGERSAHAGSETESRGRGGRGAWLLPVRVPKRPAVPEQRGLGMGWVRPVELGD
jgi:hypothetical protein